MTEQANAAPAREERATTDSASEAPAAIDSASVSSSREAHASTPRRPLRDQMTDRRDQLAELVQANTARDFGALLRLLENGRLHAVLGEQYHELVDELHVRWRDSGQEHKGEMTIKLEFSLKGGTVAIQADSSIKTPKKKREISMMFLTPERNLSRLNPDQLEMFNEHRIRTV